MKNKYGIGFFIVALMAMVTISGAYELSYQKVKEDAREEARAESTSAQEEASVRTEGTALKENCYYLLEVNGYIVVYLSDKKTPYEYTDILFDGLPSVLQEEIRNGKYIEDEEKLYGFLENYSS